MHALEELHLDRFIFNKEKMTQLLGHAMDVVPPEAGGVFFVYGSPDDSVEGIERYVKAGG